MYLSNLIMLLKLHDLNTSSTSVVFCDEVFNSHICLGVPILLTLFCTCNRVFTFLTVMLRIGLQRNRCMTSDCFVTGDINAPIHAPKRGLPAGPQAAEQVRVRGRVPVARAEHAVATGGS